MVGVIGSYALDPRPLLVGHLRCSSDRHRHLPMPGDDRLSLRQVLPSPSRRCPFHCRWFVTMFYNFFCAKSVSVVMSVVSGKPDPPGRVMVTSFTSRSVTLSWPHSATPSYVPILGYLILVRYIPQNSKYVLVRIAELHIPLLLRSIFYVQ